MNPFRYFQLAAVACALAPALASAVPQTNIPDALGEVDNLQEAKQLWLVQDVQKETKPEFFTRLEKDAAAGNVKAQATLGLCYYQGYGVKKDLAKAVELYQQAAKAGHAGAQNNLGLMYEYGTGLPVDHAKAHELYVAAAKQKLRDAEYNLGVEYDQGISVPQSWTEARSWYEKAAAQGHTAALTNLGNLYLNGHGVPVNLETAKKYLQTPADVGNPTAQYNLATCYFLQHNATEGTTYLRRAAEGGSSNAQLEWGRYLYNSAPPRRDVTKAIYWTRLALQTLTANNSKLLPKAQAQLAFMLMAQHGETDAAEAFRAAVASAQTGYPDGEFALGLCYVNGTGVASDRAAGFKWFQAAAAQKQVRAAAMLAYFYEDGGTVPRDYKEAVKWLRIAAEGGEHQAQFHLGRCYRDGTGVDIDQKEALKWFRLSVQGPNPSEDGKKALAQLSGQLNHTDAEAAFQKGVALGQAARRDHSSMVEAILALTEASDLGHPLATTALARMYRMGDGVPKDDEKAEELIARIAETTNPSVLCQIGFTYLPTGNQPPNEKYVDEALGYLERAAQHGYGPAQGPLGFCYMTASPAHQDFVAAFVWLSLAASQGDESSRAYLERLRTRLSNAQTAEATRRLSELQARIPTRSPGQQPAQ
ncbi:Sel1 domain protein repeat-containing protein [Chthoniobacter flavus Ellin428]|uniref:Sel1 domain protein repeat-containing protein n=1 Tax=Chthoniobacter flavus Ellin428 TaxID=497964 RepID=B4CW69_9BACT|nr:tetratricopeptide repeat protein [Chthoniobacter flavus]EDY21661.1 Sel1 domain protein repeat-containing protein [Chthoniobacter flavus Ellin428]TCO95599.1 hypothetical protein EV701_101286 [Chthoniobacter flavus]